MSVTSDQSSTGETPAEVLFAFFGAMLEWERAISKAEKPTDLRTARQFGVHWRKRKLKVIAQFCTPRRRVYSEGLSYGEPPEYDPDTEDLVKTVTESPRRVILITQQRVGFELTRRWVLLRRSGQWRIDSVKSRMGRGKWDRAII